MKYDPVKRRLGLIVNRSLWLRKLFYWLLDILLLRTWHVKKAVREFSEGKGNQELNVLDAGSGFGQYSWRMWRMNRNWKIYGVDVKQEQIDDCNKFFSATAAAGNVKFAYADLTKWSDAGSFNLILSVDVMEHIEDDRAVFNNFYRSLAEGGTLIISTPSDRGGSDVHTDDEDSFIEEHVRDGYGIDDITEKLSSAGFTDIKSRYTYGIPGKISWKLSMKIPVMALNASSLTAILLPIWYLIIMPFALILNFIDTRVNHVEGTGLLVTAQKKEVN